jgi:hypothetical protein
VAEGTFYAANLKDNVTVDSTLCVTRCGMLPFGLVVVGNAPYAYITKKGLVNPL